MSKFSNVKYGIIPSTNNKLVEVAVTYECDHKVQRYFIFLRKIEGTSEKAYLSEAKKRFEADIKNGKIKPTKTVKAGRNKGLVIATSLLAATTLGLGGFLTYNLITGGNGGGGGGGDKPQPGVWVKTDQDGVLVNRDQILTITKTQSPMYLIPQVLNASQFIIEEKVDMTYVFPNDADPYVNHYYIDTDNMYIKQESENLETHQKTIAYLAYRENSQEGYGVYYCYEDPDDGYKKTHILDYIASTGVETAKNKFNFSYLNQYYPNSHALDFVRNIFHTYPYDYRYDDDTGIMKDGLKVGIADYINSWKEAAPSEKVEMDYQKMDNTAIKVSNEKTAPATLESNPCTLSTEYDLFVNNGLLLNYVNNMTAVAPDYVTLSMIEEFSIKTGTFELDNLDEYFAS